MRKHLPRRLALAASCACGAVCLAISCGDDSAPPAARADARDYTGAWLMRYAGGADGTAGPVDVVRLSHEGDVVDMWGAPLDVTADGFAGTVPLGAFDWAFDLLSTDEDNLLGDMSLYDGGGTFMGMLRVRMMRLLDLPSSTLTAAGPACGATIDAGTACAYASRAAIDQDGTPDRWTVSVSGVDDTTGESFVLTFTSNAPLTAKTYTVAAAPSEMSVEAVLGYGMVAPEEDATSGTVNFTFVGDLHVTGDFSVGMVGGTLTGSFDADVVYRYHASYW